MIRWLSFGGVLACVAALLLMLWVRRSDNGRPIAPEATAGCAHAALTPHSEWTLLRHQNWFESTVDPGLRGYEIVDTRTWLAYHWSPVRNANGVRFEVRTRWALTHPGWPDDPWTLVYNCPRAGDSPPLTPQPRASAAN